MKRAGFLNSIVFLLVAATSGAFVQSNNPKACPFNISGLWRSDTATETTRLFFSFSTEGHVTLLEYSPDALPQDFEVITSVTYKLDKPSAPVQVEFTAMRGDDVFPKGVTAWKIVQYGDDSFTTVDPVSGAQTRWVREQTHRYFLTFAARRGSASQANAAVAIWTSMDGRETKTEALGIQMIRDAAGKVAPIFGPVASEVYDRIIEDSERDKKNLKGEESLLARFELTEAEFETARETFLKWDKNVSTHKLPHSDAYLNAVEFFSRAVEGVRPCGDNVKINKLTQRELEEIIAKLNPPQQPFEYISLMRKKNEVQHVTNSMYPWVWRPLIQQPGH
ncbi:MAG TPA: hypothetical protein VN687_19910 [Blastocatellia bacterium]|nr:hypothetical protein [Blastocatellia bacterium]